MDLVFDVLLDDIGNLWLTTQQGVLSIPLDDLRHADSSPTSRIRYRRFDESDGMLSSECYGATQPAGWKTADGRLFVPTYRGLAMIDPTAMQPDLPTPTAVIDRFVVDGEDTDTPPYLLRPGANQIELHFTAPSFVSSRKTRFRYWLDGYQESWVDSGERRLAHFAGLGPGRYTFRVIASTDDGQWSDREASLSFEIQPQFWQTKWFLTLVALALVVLGPAVHRYRTVQLARRQRELEETVAQRTAELADANEKLEKLATVDGLTELANHRHFRTILRSEWNRHDRSHKPLSLLLIDVDHFKLFNDHFGHLEGDRALRLVARLLDASASRPGDLAARYGGEEFAVILSETDSEGARQVAEKLRREVHEARIPHETSPIADYLTISIGVATAYPREATSPDRLIGAADTALYQAKNGGRNTVRSVRA